MRTRSMSAFIFGNVSDPSACANGVDCRSRLLESPRLMPDPSNPQPPLPANFVTRTQQFLQDYSWIIVRNVIGWLFMLLALPIGVVVPGPLGFPLFLIGFGLVTFPGKRKLTARVL